MTLMSRSPAGPPFLPAPPWPRRDTAWPLSMPAGMVTVMRRCLRTLPVPPQLLQGWWMILPLPPHLGQVVVVAKVKAPPPRWMRIWPLPWQSGQISAVVPGAQPVPWHSSQGSVRVRFSSFSQPKAASSKEMVTEARRVSPFMGPVRWRLEPPPPKPPPKKEPKMSPRSMSPISKPPKPPNPPPGPPAPKLGSTPAWPNWS